MQEALRMVQSGVGNFAPSSDSPNDLRAFQPLAKALFAAHQDGLLNSASFIVSKKRDTHDMYVTVVTSGGLTYKGDQWLATASNQPSETRKWLIDSAAKIVIGVFIAILAAAIAWLWGLK
jgi:hypothetical protein